MVGHDLRNPLQAIENAAFYLNNEFSNIPDSSKIKETVQVIHRSIDYADNIVNDLLCFASTRKAAFLEIDINDLIKETLLQINIPKNVKTVTELDVTPRIVGDKQMLKRVFVNLALNGIQAMEEKGGTLKIETKKVGDYIEMKTTDNGIGIKDEYMQKIFTPFFTTKAQGMGVGLAICKRFVEIHEGTIEVESKEGEGSIFTIKLPIKGTEVKKSDEA
jgi:two-component system NtrC family sensor kinase